MKMLKVVKPVLAKIHKLEYLAKRADGSYVIKAVALFHGPIYINFSKKDAHKLQELISKDLGYWPEGELK